jgi:hypothetical protein
MKMEETISPPVDTKAADPPPAMDKIIRNRQVDQDAAELAKKRLLPRAPGKKLTFEEMQEYLALLTPEMWHHVVIYVYRLKPRILRQLKTPDNPKYIDCLSRPFDLEYIIEHHGGGDYNIMAVDTEAKIHSEANKLFECNFDIPITKHEPKLNYEELDINYKGNMAYIQLLQHRGILDNKGQVMATQANGPGGNSDIVRQVLEFASKMTADQQEALRVKISPSEQSLNKSVGDILLEKMKQDDPNKHLVGLLGIIKEVLATNKPADGSTQVLEKVIQIQSEHNKTVLQLFEKLTDARRNPDAPNPQMEQFEQILGLAERLSGFRGAGRRSGWDVGLDYAKEIGVPLLQTIGNLVSLRMNGRAMPNAPTAPAPGAAAPAPPAAAFDPYANPAAMRAFANSMATTQPAPAGISTAAITPEIVAPPAGAELAALIQNYGGLLVTHLNMGTPGWQFADMITGLMGNSMHAQVIAQGESALLQALLSVPETAMFGELRLRKFVNEFVHFQEYLDQDEEEEAEGTTDYAEIGTNVYRPPAAREQTTQRGTR